MGIELETRQSERVLRLGRLRLGPAPTGRVGSRLLERADAERRPCRQAQSRHRRLRMAQRLVQPPQERMVLGFAE
jgi:hypothetical protein